VRIRCFPNFRTTNYIYIYICKCFLNFFENFIVSSRNPMKTVRPRAVFLRVLVETMRFRCNFPCSPPFSPGFTQIHPVSGAFRSIFYQFASVTAKFCCVWSRHGPHFFALPLQQFSFPEYHPPPIQKKLNTLRPPVFFDFFIKFCYNIYRKDEKNSFSANNL